MKKLSFEIMNAAFAVHSELGPGLLESAYEKALVLELTSRGLKVEPQKRVPIMYRGVDLNIDERDMLRCDLFIEDSVVVELKSVEEMRKVYFKQTKTYMRFLGAEEGLLINFNVPSLKEGTYLVNL